MRASDALALFESQFAGRPAVIASAPGRVNIIGEHTDYNGGQVLPIAINRRTYIAIRPAPHGNRSRVFSPSQSGIGELDSRSPKREGAWWDYISGVCATLLAANAEVPQFDATVCSEVPPGAGLSSSAALEVAASLALFGLSGRQLDKKELALVAWRAENEFVGVNCGVMDQFASALAQPSRATHLWCDTLETESIPMTECVLIFDTATARSLRSSEFNNRRAECEQALRLLRREFGDLPNLAAATPGQIAAVQLPPVLERRALHVVEENARVSEVVAALKSTGQIPGEKLYESHESLRLQYDCSTTQLDWFVDQTRRFDGISGARLTGAGWGGCAIAVGSREVLSAAAETLASDYTARFGVRPRTWLTFAAEGAALEQV
jgi:galactokinase